MMEYEYEPIPGLPGPLPAGEVLLWQGAPRWRSLVRHAFHERGLILYFAALVLWYVVATARHADALSLLAGTAWFAGLAVLAIGILDGFAWLVARTTRYTVTSKRVVMRFGIALPMTINLPFKLIESAGMAVNRDGTGDLLLTLMPGENVSYAVLWPHVRPWHFLRAKPMLRAVPDVERAGAVLARALALSHGQAAAAMQSETRTAPTDARVPA